MPQEQTWAPADLLGVRAGWCGGQPRAFSLHLVCCRAKEGPGGKGKGTTERSLWTGTEEKGAETRVSKRSKQRGGQGSEQADRQEAVDGGQNVSMSDAQGEQTRLDAERPRMRAGTGTERRPSRDSNCSQLWADKRGPAARLLSGSEVRGTGPRGRESRAGHAASRQSMAGEPPPWAVPPGVPWASLRAHLNPGPSPALFTSRGHREARAGQMQLRCGKCTRQDSGEERPPPSSGHCDAKSPAQASLGLSHAGRGTPAGRCSGRHRAVTVQCRGRTRHPGRTTWHRSSLVTEWAQHKAQATSERHASPKTPRLSWALGSAQNNCITRLK